MTGINQQNRIARLAASIADLEVDALLISDEVNVRYLSGFTGDSTWLLVRPDASATLLSDGRYKIQLAQECPALPAVIRPPSQKMGELLAEVVSGLSGVRRIGLEADHVHMTMYRDLQSKLSDVTWVETSARVERLRAIKDADEVATIRRSISIAQQAFKSVTANFSAKKTEADIHYELEAEMRSLGAEGVSFHPIIGAEPNGALPHYHPGNVPLGDCRTLLMDWGAKVDGYCSDLTRTLHRPGSKSATSDRFAAAYEAVLEAQLAAIAAIRDGVEAVTVDAAARAVLAKAGLGDAFNHGLGHGFGLQIHEDPRMGPSSTETLRTGMVLTVEPGVYFENEFGIRIEDDLLVTDTGCEVLSDLPKGLDDCPLVM
ncbi:M24 family metallopeptidase [Aporhodopirellula aestuarii]|uniref:Xaa-Pro peptidase family protein n=1 Tax=Aporhodopirellula aestuarii TaxID=2950107 RepID=A0ABT0U0X6_9BACT|nr:Xaa-Pro peptidase family protein [Aporhodopirellula aestuarii]MCM2370476.1 Xaa-Pro peptidase family protein [Aporhodopirellula aestuarii]